MTGRYYNLYGRWKTSNTESGTLRVSSALADSGEACKASKHLGARNLDRAFNLHPTRNTYRAFSLHPTRNSYRSRNINRAHKIHRLRNTYRARNLDRAFNLHA